MAMPRLWAYGLYATAAVELSAMLGATRASRGGACFAMTHRYIGEPWFWVMSYFIVSGIIVWVLVATYLIWNEWGEE